MPHTRFWAFIKNRSRPGRERSGNRKQQRGTDGLRRPGRTYRRPATPPLRTRSSRGAPSSPARTSLGPENGSRPEHLRERSGEASLPHRPWEPDRGCWHGGRVSAFDRGPGPESRVTLCSPRLDSGSWRRNGRREVLVPAALAGGGLAHTHTSLKPHSSRRSLQIKWLLRKTVLLI